MKGPEKRTAPLIRPELPQTYPGANALEVKATVVGVVGLVVCVGLIFAVVREPDMPFAARAALILMGLAVAAFCAVPSTRVVRSVRLDDDGVTVRGMFRTQSMPWDDIGDVHFAFESKADKQRRAQAIGGGGLVGGLVGDLAVGGSVSGGDGDHRTGDPFEDGRLRKHYDPAAEFIGADGRRLAKIDGSLGWAFFTELRAESVAREIPVTIAGLGGAAPRRRR
jgi:hypothetical protein